MKHMLAFEYLLESDCKQGNITWMTKVIECSYTPRFNYAKKVYSGQLFGWKIRDLGNFLDADS